MSSLSSSLKIFASVAILTLIGGYGISKLYNNNNTFHTPKQKYYDYDYDYYDDYDYDYDCEISDDDTEKVVITSKKSLTSSNYTYTNTTTNTSNTLVASKNSSKHKPSISKKHYILIEDLIMNITTKQNQAIYFRKKYHKNLNGILKQIDELREKICDTEAEHLKNIHKLLDKIENYHKKHEKNEKNEKNQKNVKNEKNLEKDESHIKELENRVIQEEAYLETELKVLQTDLGMLMWKYEELENYASREWENSQLEIKQLREKLMNNATRLSKMVK